MLVIRFYVLIIPLNYNFEQASVYFWVIVMFIRGISACMIQGEFIYPRLWNLMNLSIHSPHYFHNRLLMSQILLPSIHSIHLLIFPCILQIPLYLPTLLQPKVPLIPLFTYPIIAHHPDPLLVKPPVYLPLHHLPLYL